MRQAKRGRTSMVYKAGGDIDSERTASADGGEIRRARQHGPQGEWRYPSGASALRLTHPTRLFVIDPKHADEETLMEIALEAGADDVQLVEEYYEVTCDPKQFEVVRQALEAANIPTESAETSYIPANYVDLDVEAGKKMLKLRDQLDDNDDVQNVYANDNLPEEVLAD